MTTSILLDGATLTVENVISVARDFAAVSIDPVALGRLAETRRVVESAAASQQAVYGINTGFGKLASVKIEPDQLLELQRNLVVSHASGFGDPLPLEVVRALMLLRLNGLLNPASGVRPLVPERLAMLLNRGIHPVVPEQGSVGASGDLAPLAHLALMLMGQGEVDVVPPPSSLLPPPRGGGNGEEGGSRVAAAVALRDAGIEPIAFEAKEGLALVNGTQAQTAVLTLLVHDARNLWRTAHGAAALTLEALKGSPDAFDARLHQARPHRGQVESAALMRELLEGSAIRESHRYGDPRVQDAYSVRCVPQILGAVGDAIEHAAVVVDVEINAATDNPLVLDGDIVSGGNFHGQPVAMSSDFLAIALTSLAGMSERRIERIVNPELSGGLPPFLATNPGLESGLMMVQIAAAAVAAECRVLSTPASVQSIPTDANQEDVVPMGMTAALKARKVLENAQRITACELLCGAQGLEHHRPLESSPGVEALYDRVRRVVKPLTGDRSLTTDIGNLTALIKEEALV